MKIAALTTVSGPYIVARYSAFVEQLKEASFYLVELGSVSNIYLWNSDLKTPYERVILSEIPAEKQSSFTLFKNISQTLEKINPDILIICGYGVPGMAEALIWSLWKKIPAILLSETKEDDAKRIWWREALKSFMVKRYNAALVGGQPQKRYLLKLGMPEEAIFLGYNVVGNKSFSPSTLQNLHPPLSRPLSKPYFLSVNRFVGKKNLPFLISCYSQYREVVGNSAWDLVLCGDGELRSEIEKLIATYGLENSVHLPGFLQENEMLPYFHYGNCFIHASTQEQWGLVVNEAMAAGLPVLVSKVCGCFEDLVNEGINGFGFDPHNGQELTELMIKISSNQVDLAAMKQASLTHIKKFSPDYFAEGLSKAINYCLMNT